MKKALFTSLGIAVLSLLLISSKPLKVACIGDSITYGACLKDRENENYTAILQKLLGEGYEVTNYGISARVMLQKGDHPFMKENNYAKAKASNPDIVTIMLGTNDSKSHNWVYGNEFEKDYTTMVTEFAALPSHPTIYVCLPPWVEKYSCVHINDSTIVKSIIPTIKKVARKNHLVVVDTHSTIEGQKDKLVDGIHPNPAGDILLAVEIYKAIKEQE